ncbi:MAG: sugar phosphate isomerase/epimerase [Clostridia bacterium]|nr:sugar phosphate isomerase/epimerase [Clostridia bacterium]
MERKVALQIQHDGKWEQMLEISADCGFRYVSMGFGSSKCFHRDDWQAETEKIRTKLDTLGLRCVMTHAPYYDLRISADFLDEAMETALLRCVKATSILGGEIMAIHPRGYYRDEGPVPENGFYGNGKEVPEESYAHNIKNLRPLVEEAIRCGCRVGVENLPVFPGWAMTFCSHDLVIHKRLIDDLDPAGVCGVWDFGHAYLTHADSAAVLAAFGNRICGTHVHDNDKKGDHHWTPFSGTINWQAEMAALAGNGYAGYLTMELVYDHLYTDTPALREFVRTAYENCCKLEDMMKAYTPQNRL